MVSSLYAPCRYYFWRLALDDDEHSVIQQILYDYSLDLMSLRTYTFVDCSLP